ncbi:WxL protein peptidoglycan domain-containing protein [Apilactobacillus ozensis]|uniref:WxL protein peptidoglycan domain-containing protein n=1 Tax=Apilactobacillus ozensis TaxID=866801 RepID=UPI00200A6952|nr:DUF916 domain-containing protein [Apilactobacillus ozensis]MCK8607130.1 DUF916 domain-containing protein [Apilactobacillus ozensis]
MINFLKFTLILFISIFCANFINVKADSFNYSVNPILPNSLQNKGYFDYKVHRNQKIKLWIEVNNDSDKTIVVKNSLNDGFNDENGIISYSSDYNSSTLSRSKLRLSSMVVGKSIKYSKLLPHSSSRVFFRIQIPKKYFKGDVIGGINSFICNQSKYFNANSSVKNLVNYSTTVLLRHKVLKSSLKNIHLNDAKVKNNMLNICMLNLQSKVFYGYNISVQLIKNNKVILKRTSKYSMVPMSFGYYKIFLFNVNPGKYKLKVTVYDKHHKEYFYKNIFIKSSYQLLGTYSQKNKSSFIYIIFFVLLITFTIMILFILKYLKISRWY